MKNIPKIKQNNPFNSNFLTDREKCLQKLYIQIILARLGSATYSVGETHLTGLWRKSRVVTT